MNNSQGWVRLHRQFLEWEWFNDPNVFRLFIYCLLKANHKDKRYKGKLIKRGEFVTGRDILSKEVGLSVQQIRTALNKLKSTNEITIKSTKQGTIIQIVKYNYFQIVTNESTNNQPTSNQQVTTNKNVKKEKNEKNIYREFAHLSISLDEIQRLKERFTQEQIDDMLDRIENYSKNTQYKNLNLTLRNWLAREYPDQKTRSQKAKDLINNF